LSDAIDRLLAKAEVEADDAQAPPMDESWDEAAI
jgi:hypothetical protein